MKRLMRTIVERSALIGLALGVAACGRSSKPAGESESPESAVPNCATKAECPDCTTTSECPEGGICRDDVCLLPTSCESQEDCGINRECDLETSTCVECLTGNHCAPEQTCLGKVCRDSCEGTGDCPKQQTCAENGFCAECLNDSACPDDEHCAQGNCVRDVCAQRGTRCDDQGDVLVCSQRGDGETKLRCPVNESCGTDQGPAWCQGWVCVPGQSSCADDANVAEHCSEDGLTIASSEDCDDTDSLCNDGECKPIICEPFTNYCSGGHVYSCDGVGVSGTIADFCEAYEYCEEETATCQFQVCTPNAGSCDDQVTRTCNDDGSGWDPDGTDCDDLSNHLCVGGVCLEVICAPNERSCNEKLVLQCNSLGTAESTLDVCGAGEYCSGGAFNAACYPHECTPNAPICFDEVATVCRPDGSGFDFEGEVWDDCAFQGMRCWEGSCAVEICSQETFCQGGDHYQCTSHGTQSSLLDECEEAEYCDESAGCLLDTCQSNTAYCDDETALLCDNEGSGPVGSGQDCAALGQACHAGACQPIICSGVYDCTDNVLSECVDNGTALAEMSACEDDEYCDTNLGACRPRFCEELETACAGVDQVVTCNAEGSAYEFPGSPCQSGEICSKGMCLDEADVCTIAGKGWGNSTIVDGGTGTETVDDPILIGSDSGNNLFVSFGLDNAYYVRRYDASTMTWSPRVEILGEHTTSAALAVSAAGSAMLVYPNAQGVMARSYDPATDTWSPEAVVHAGVTNHSVQRIGVDESGRFIAFWRLYTPAEQVFSAAYIPDFGWEAPVRIDLGGEVPPDWITASFFDVDVSQHGAVMAVFRARKGTSAAAYLTWRTLGDSSWSPPEALVSVVAPTIGEPVRQFYTTWLSKNESRAQFIYYEDSYEAKSVEWTPLGGLETVTTMRDAVPFGFGDVVKLETGDVHYYQYGDFYSKPAGSNAFGVSPDRDFGFEPLSNNINFPRGEVLIAGEERTQTTSDVFQLDANSVWTRGTLDGSYMSFAKLSDCRAAAVVVKEGRVQVLFRE